ncbi:alpha/beta fold hydrolase [Siminovitchia terrae]|uniref:Alpha/beta fold hydrolase n=2 Tax=Siminovitchia terrae TaxID=1914933 RepID=A0A429X3F9_SIMTE|nr:alpha/beta fold hydrolase [Siminovitchia terrae]RST57890.1 alpha/beta fold hydrolase [Siminovitchia terrae]
MMLEPMNSSPVTRKRPGTWINKKIVWTAGIIIILLGFAACIGISVFVGTNLTKPVKKEIEVLPSDYEMAYKDIEFMSKDEETKLSGWVLEPSVPAKMNVIFAHGYKGNRYEENIPFLPLASNLLADGYRVIMFDFRYAGESEGEMTTVGVKEKLDLIGAIDWTTANYEEPVGLLGISMGASTSILAAADSEAVIAVVADSPFSDLHDYLKVNMPVWTDLPNFPFTPLILTIIPMMADIDLEEASPISVLDKISPRPILFIHNKGDESIPYTESEMMVKKDPEHFTLWLTEGKGHVKSFEQNSKEYVEEVKGFLDDALAGVKK